MKADVEIAKLKAENQYLRQQNRWLLEQLRLARHRRFGTSSEKGKAHGHEQLSMFEKTDPGISVEEKREEIKGYHRRKPGHVGTARLPEDLPVEIIEHELPPEERLCPECGEQLHVMGREMRDELKFIPAQATIVRHISHTYACRHCEKQGEHVPILKASMPSPVIKGSFAAPEAIAHIAYEKFVMGAPLYRQEQDWARKGIMLSRQTMSGWLIRTAQEWLQPIYDALKSRLIQQEVLHADETVVQVLREPSKSPQSKSYMWMYRTGCDAENAIILYEYQPGRQARHPRAFLEGYRGYLHADGYDGYHDLPPDISVVGCWAHVRRRFHDALKAIPVSAQAHAPPMEGVWRIAQLYKLEEMFRQLLEDGNDFSARLKARQQQSKPLVDSFFEWCAVQYDRPRSHFDRAVNYALSQRFWLEKYLLDGRLEIDNNRAERSIKPFVIGRKNWLFCNSQDGAKASAIFYSLIETAKENGLNPFDYLTYVFKNAPNLNLSHDSDTIDLLLPFRPIETAPSVACGCPTV